MQVCGFVPMQGAAATPEHHLPLHQHVSLRIDGPAPGPGLLEGVLEQPAVRVWTGVAVRRMESFDGLELRLATTVPGFATLTAEPAAVEAGLVAPALPDRAAAVVAESTLAYLTLRPTYPDELGRDRFEFGVIAHGPDATTLADTIDEQVCTWDANRAGPAPTITAHPADTPDELLPTCGLVFDRNHTRLTVAWPTRQP
ncbi:hypothetical protein GCM10010123_20150 [Pilimelia anulata]|uniref:Uncharacterized protein n=1 Tax=Pilimelia anulata TaxID=53371 RepID=A0A8J3F9Y8_9ACTN|nr:hypothetical protein GCM10010123_20150 [Pilimelia anulata]